MVDIRFIWIFSILHNPNSLQKLYVDNCDNLNNLPLLPNSLQILKYKEDTIKHIF